MTVIRAKEETDVMQLENLGRRISLSPIGLPMQTYQRNYNPEG